MSSISVFCITKNEAQFIGYSVMSVLDHVQEIVFADGNSTDGTLEILDYISQKYDKRKKLRVYQDMDCKDLTDDYTALFNKTMGMCNGKFLWFLHPDMIVTNPQSISDMKTDGQQAFYVNMRSFAGEDLDTEITKGRTNKWKTIMANDLGLHYWGTYGHAAEDMYFRDITGNEHVYHKDMNAYPYTVGNSGINVEHYCECKPRNYRAEKMGKVLRTSYAVPEDGLRELVDNHPRVHLQDASGQWGDYKFEKRKDQLPDVFAKYQAEFNEILEKRK